MNFVKNLFLASAISLATVHTASAIGAFPRPIVMRQPDGTTLTVRIMGDENYHYVTTADGYLLKKDASGFFCYVDYDFDTGTQTVTAQRAHNVSDRTADEKTLLARLKGAPTVNADIKRRTAVRRMAPATRLGKKVVAPRMVMGKNAEVKESQYLVILVNFADSTFRHTNSDFDRWLNEKGYSVNGGTGSVKDYYRDNSNGQFVPNFKVVGPYTLSQPTEYYGGNSSSTSGTDSNPRDMVREALELARTDNPDLDFRQFDNDGDGEMDNCYIIYAGYSEASTANANDIWPHSWNMGDDMPVYDGIAVNNYSCSAELVGMPGLPAIPSMDGIGTFTHEFGHVLGLKDMYDTDSDTGGYGIDPGNYSLFASGSYNNDSRTPPCLMAFERWQMGWLQEGDGLVEMKDAEDVTLENIAQNKARFINAQPNRAAGTGVEWIIFENRQQKGWDRYIPAHGLLVTHFDYTSEMQKQYWSVNGPNNNASHRCMYIKAADGIDDANTRSGDTFPGSSANTSLTDTTTPNTLNWEKEPLNVPITNITEDKGIVKFQVSGGQTVWNVIKTEKPEDVRDMTATFIATVENSKVDIDEVGFCWTEGDDEPTLADNCEAVSDISQPRLEVEDLEPGCTYSVRSYMKMSDGTTVYGSSVSFSTECESVTTPFVADFTSWTNGQPDCWQIVDNNADGTSWVTDESSNSIVYSYNGWNDADDYVICKRRIHVPDNGVLFFTRGVADETAVESLEVLVSTKTSQVSDFHVVERFSFADYFSQSHMEEVDLSEYAGKDVYIAFRCTSEKLQGDLWLWDMIVTEKLATPAITAFSRKDDSTLHLEWTPVSGVTSYYVYLGKETTTVNQQALFCPMDYYEDVQGDVTLGNGTIFFKSSGMVTLKTIPEGLDDCRFVVTTSGPVGTSELFVEGTRDGGLTWQTIGGKTSLSEYDSEGQNIELTSYLKDKKFTQLRFRFNHNGRNGKIKYLTLIFNDGMEYETLAAGAVYDTKVDITNKTAGEFDSGKYKAWVASGYYNLFFDESAPAYYSASTSCVRDVIDGTGIGITVGNGQVALSGLPSGSTVRCTSVDGTELFAGQAQSDRLAFPTTVGTGVVIISVEANGQSFHTKAIIK